MDVKLKTEHELNVEVARSHQATTLLSDPIFTESIDKLRNHYTDLIMAEKDEAARNKLWNKFHALNAVVQEIQDVVNTGKIARNKLKNNV